jgi:hypothetical protein
MKDKATFTITSLLAILFCTSHEGATTHAWRMCQGRDPRSGKITRTITTPKHTPEPRSTQSSDFA